MTTTYRVWGPNDLYAYGIQDPYYANRMVGILQAECIDTFSCDGCTGPDPCYHVQEVEDDEDEPHYGIWGNYDTLAEWEANSK